MKTIALSLTTLLMAASSTASTPSTMGSLAIQDAPLEESCLSPNQNCGYDSECCTGICSYDKGRKVCFDPILFAFADHAVETFQAQKNIVALAAGDKDLSTLVAAVTEAHLVSALEGKGPFTVFAPTNEAFAKLPSGVLSKLLKPQNVGQLKSILTYHVVKGAVHASDLRDGEMVTTLEGQKLRVTINRAGDVFIDGAKVTTANVDASNGVVHIIDSVLLPPAQKWHGGLRSSW